MEHECRYTVKVPNVDIQVSRIGGKVSTFIELGGRDEEGNYVRVTIDRDTLIQAHEIYSVLYEVQMDVTTSGVIGEDEVPF